MYDIHLPWRSWNGKGGRYNPNVNPMLLNSTGLRYCWVSWMSNHLHENNALEYACQKFHECQMRISC